MEQRKAVNDEGESERQTESFKTKKSRGRKDSREGGGLERLK